MGHGDSILVEAEEPTGTRRILVDCNTVKSQNGARRNPALEYLQARGATSLDLVVVTHLHRDHYSGLEQILDTFDVLNLAIPPFLSTNSELFKKLIQKYARRITEVINNTSDDDLVGQMESLAALLAFATTNDDKVFEATGPDNRFAFAGSELVLHFQLPLRSIRGLLHRRIQDDDFDLDYFPEMNDASIAILLEYEGERLLLSADSTLSQWSEHERQIGRRGTTNLSVNVLKVSHHGSKHNTDLRVLNYLFSPTAQPKIALVSANGRSHPHDEFFELVNSLSLQPYCTNLAKQCVPDNVSILTATNKIPTAALPFVQHYQFVTEPIPCQGDITVTVDSGLQVVGSTGNGCVYR